MSDSAPPIRCVWDGACFTPAGIGWAKRADRYYVVDEQYDIVEHHERSQKSHGHYFATVKTAWENLPDNMAARFPTEEHLRKYALIRAGYHNSHNVVFQTAEDAARARELIRPMDEHSVVRVDGNVVTVYTAQSQSYRAMGKERFQMSKDAVLDVLATMLGTTTKQLEGAE